MTEKDERAVAHAIADTFKFLLNGTKPLTQENVERLLYYSLNPWCTTGSFDFLAQVVAFLEDGKEP